METKTVLYIGHRGSTRNGPDNTIPSLLTAQDEGAWGAEFDVRFTSDGVPILLHDATFGSIWSSDAAPGDLSIDQVRELRPKDGADARVPTVAEASSALSMQLVVDGKEASLVTEMIAAVDSANALERAWFIGEPSVLTEVRRCLPDARIIMSCADASEPDSDVLAAVRPFALNLPWGFVSTDVVDQVHSWKYELWTYTVDTRDDASTAQSLGVDAIISNCVADVLPD